MLVVSCVSLLISQTPGGERWYVEKIELTYNSSDKHFEHIDQPSEYNQCQFHAISWMFQWYCRQDHSIEHRTETQFHAVPHASRQVVRLLRRNRDSPHRRQESCQRAFEVILCSHQRINVTLNYILHTHTHTRRQKLVRAASTFPNLTSKQIFQSWNHCLLQLTYKIWALI